MLPDDAVFQTNLNATAMAAIRALVVPMVGVDGDGSSCVQ